MIKSVQVKEDVYMAYISILYYIVNEIIPKQYHILKYKSIYNKDLHYWHFPSVGNRIKLSKDGKTRHKAIHFGVKRLFNGSYEQCLGNIRYPELYSILKEIAKNCWENFEYNQILINYNNIFKKHKDNKNIGSNSLIFGFGPYTKGELYIEDKPYDIKNPIIFDGKLLEHEVKEFEGDRYSVIYYKI